MLRGNRYRIYPNKEQKSLMEKHFGSCRFVYNKLLEIKSLMYKKFRISLSEFDLNNYLLVLKEVYPWLKEVNAGALQQASRNLNSAFNHFFKDELRYPQKKHKKDHHFSFQIPQHYSINFATSKILLPKLGWIKVKMHRPLFKEMELESDIIKHDNNAEFLRTLTVSRTPTGKYYVSILTEDGEKLQEKQEYSHATMVGVDVGINTFAACSNGEKIDNPRFLKASLQRLKFLQREVSRKVIGSNNRRKAVRKLALIHEKISNQRHDFQHKVSTKLISENQAIAVETLNISGMKKNHKLAQAISDSAWYSFVQKLMYKAEWVGKTIIKIGQWEPSSKNCNVCGYHNSELSLDIREWQCPECGTFHDRDINAAINIKKIAVGTTV
ncbi:MAG: RNA-guided endonuclease TnpB family protein [Methanosarcina sp.]|uniref:RNA-guided endonuclease TnpB family protein n=1 Tax=Methanosarcina sp. TaxID=2213 RepID=UPI0026261207|nr:RNA-guided endonuclease TnpB family protein [Methanosarcina sp.]MDD3245651.1 RNA-guided endonuclease TnpB family protein [Methanosarcina sp.]